MYVIFPYFYKKDVIMSKSKEDKKARFDTRLTKEQKKLMEKAARLGGYRSLTDFVLSTAQEQAIEIIKKREEILSSDKDSEIFFDAVTNPPQPNTELLNAANEYNEKVKG